MNDLPGLTRQPQAPIRPFHCVRGVGFDDWRKLQLPAIGQWLDAQKFTAASGSSVLLPGTDGIEGAVIGVGDIHDPFAHAHAPFALPPGDWKLAGELDAEGRRALLLGWGLGSYRFRRYKQPLREPARLVLDGHADAETLDILAACLRVRDLVNTPTEHMGPDELEAVVREIAERRGGRVEVIAGDQLLERNYPAIHAVGRASHRAPRLIQLEWGEPDAPRLALVGKGVCFDTGGLNLKASAGMRNMKKDMGGAAHAIALAELIMARGLPLRLSLFVAAVENAVGPNALRPGEVIATRKGTRVEIDNTDAEGRLVLCDALTRAGEDDPALMLDFATLTGAARIALGPDLPALYANDDGIADAWRAAGDAHFDPVWRMPLWKPYLRYLASGIADLANGSGTPMAGSVTAALYLQHFVADTQPWAHLDVYSWNDNDRPGRPAGGEAQALRSAFAMLKARFG
ncbi:leucyl aminopeptidase family protein [Lysobacter pythonis]|uniref:Leucyl aminopeptidase family protein n=1 Tax=Solilutibacter pythonis TaxID=2483112 RepID=A0A3M2HZU9_9GAMM|nr:leucyl aminopeptidase family protein [Lysobacter pythonis]RMH93413.1 leucyl aminopeptidase family protein [Lysobacter pythonis]